MFKDVKTHRRKLEKLSSIESVKSTSSSSSEDSVELEKKEEKETLPSSWKILKLCEPEKGWMITGILAAIAVGSSFPTFAILFGETYGVNIDFILILNI